MRRTARRTVRRTPLALGLAAACALAGCSGSGDVAATSSTSSSPSSSPTTSAAPSTSAAPTTGASPATPSSAPSTPAVERTIQVTITGRTIRPAPAAVPLKVGQTLRLVVTSDHDDELHAHGFEVEKKLTAGQPTTVDLKGTEPGVYEVETHEPALRLMTIQVR